MAIVKQAAKDLVDILDDEEGNQVAIGLVPWHYRVRLNQTTRQNWESNNWAEYPTSQYYPYPNPQKNTGVTYTPLPAKSEAWDGCPDQRGSTDYSSLDSSMDPPSVADPFPMGFYTNRRPNRSESIRFECTSGSPPPFYCYSHRHMTSPSRGQPPQLGCTSVREITPLTTDNTSIKTAINNLSAAPSSQTHSATGVVWAQRLLTHEWQSAWGNSVHPVDPTKHTDVRKALVLLTDGEDNYTWNARQHLRTACTAAKSAGIKVFTIAAIANTRSGHQTELKNCSSQADDPDGRYVFVNNATPEALEEAFRDIARQLLEFRRVA